MGSVAPVGRLVVHGVARRGHDVVAVGPRRAATDRSVVGPHVGGQIRMVVVDAAVDLGHHHRPRAGREAPGGRDVLVASRGARRAVRHLAGVEKSPLHREARVVRTRRLVEKVIGLRVAHATLSAEEGDDGGDARRGHVKGLGRGNETLGFARGRPPRRTQARIAGSAARSHGSDDRPPLLSRHVRVKAEEHLPGAVGPRGGHGARGRPGPSSKHDEDGHGERDNASPPP